MKRKIPLSLNAPATMIFAVICTILLILDTYIFRGKITMAWFTAPASIGSHNGFNWENPLHYIRLISYVFGHGDWSHLLGNLAYILLLGPLMEERYGSKIVSLMILMTTLVTGVINVCLIPSQLYGASGICFMLILLTSLNGIEKKRLPVSFLALLAVYIAKEFLGARTNYENVSVIAHIAGGLCGSLFGFLVAPKERKNSTKTPSKAAAIAKIDAASPRFSEKKPAQKKDDDITLVGTIKL